MQGDANGEAAAAGRFTVMLPLRSASFPSGVSASDRIRVRHKREGQRPGVPVLELTYENGRWKGQARAEFGAGGRREAGAARLRPAGPPMVWLIRMSLADKGTGSAPSTFSRRRQVRAPWRS